MSGNTSGTYNYNPSVGELVIYAFARCGIRGTAITAEHMRDARNAANMVLADWANDQPNFWTVDLQTVQCVYGQAEYTVPANTILILDAYIAINPGTPNEIDLYMYPISRTEWAAFPNKTTPGRPTVYWFDRLISPNVTIWQPPTDPSWTFNYYRVRQMQDAAYTQGQNVEVPYYFLKAFADGLSAELAVMYAPDRAAGLATLAEKSFVRARNRNIESTPWFITTGLQGYYR